MMGGACGTYGEKRNENRILVGKLEGEKTTWGNEALMGGNIKKDLAEIWERVD
jgi:hypothetical protein